MQPFLEEKNLHFQTKTDRCWQGLNVKGPLNLSSHFFSTNQLMRKCLLLMGSQIKKNLNRCPNTPSAQSHDQLQMGVWFKALLISLLFLEYLGKISFNRKMTQSHSDWSPWFDNLENFGTIFFECFNCLKIGGIKIFGKLGNIRFGGY